MNIEEKFNEFFNKFLIANKDSFDKLETQRNLAMYERKNNKKIIFIVEFILLVIFIFLVIVFGLEKNNDTIPELCFLVAFFFPMIIALKKRQKLEEYEDIYQNKIIRNIIQYFSPDLKYYPNETIGYEDYQKMGIENFTEFNSSNIIRGMYKNNEIIFSKIITKYVYTYNDYEGLFENVPTIRKKSSSKETFDGIFIKAKLSKNVNADLYIKSKAHLIEKLFINNISEMEGKKYSKIDIYELNNFFNVYSSNSEIDISILDSEMNSILIDIYNNQNFELVVKNNYIYIRFWIDGLFSNPPLERKVDDKDILYKNYKILYLVFYLLTKLEERI